MHQIIEQQMTMYDYTKGYTTSSTRSQHDEGLRAYLLAIYRNMAAALSITAITAYMVSSIASVAMALYTTPLAYVVIFSPLIYVWFFSSRMQTMSPEQAMMHLGIFAALNGLSLGSIFLVYTSASIVKTLLITASMFGAMSIYGNSTNRDLTSLGSFAYMGVIGLIIASIINIIMQSPALEFAIAFAGVIAFTILTAYDIQKLKSLYYSMHGNGLRAGNIAIYGALTLYLDFINLFIMLLHFLGVKKRD